MRDRHLAFGAVFLLLCLVVGCGEDITDTPVATVIPEVITLPPSVLGQIPDATLLVVVTLTPNVTGGTPVPTPRGVMEAESPKSTPIIRRTENGTFKTISAGRSHTCGLKWDTGAFTQAARKAAISLNTMPSTGSGPRSTRCSMSSTRSSGSGYTTCTPV